MGNSAGNRNLADLVRFRIASGKEHDAPYAPDCCDAHHRGLALRSRQIAGPAPVAGRSRRCWCSQWRASWKCSADPAIRSASSGGNSRQSSPSRDWSAVSPGPKAGGSDPERPASGSRQPRRRDSPWPRLQSLGRRRSPGHSSGHPAARAGRPASRLARCPTPGTARRESGRPPRHQPSGPVPACLSPGSPRSRSDSARTDAPGARSSKSLAAGSGKTRAARSSVGTDHPAHATPGLPRRCHPPIPSPFHSRPPIAGRCAETISARGGAAQQPAGNSMDPGWKSRSEAPRIAPHDPAGAAAVPTGPPASHRRKPPRYQ